MREILSSVENTEEVKPAASKRNHKQTAQTIRFQSENTVLKNVNDDHDVRRLIHNMMEMDGGTMMKNITSVSIAMFGERYASMNSKDWSRLINEYVRTVTNRPDLEEETVFQYKPIAS